MPKRYIIMDAALSRSDAVFGKAGNWPGGFKQIRPDDSTASGIDP
ncbi:hypothetical protein AA105894_2785 [Asaia spathodeae NBRC 105894]|nr:hypothetical protein AA105894_2785 [Asaia spathodeae NBRC 105894]